MPPRDIEFYIYSKGFTAMSVCVLKEASKKSIETNANIENPTGISSKWRVSPSPTFKGGEKNPCPCNHEPDKRLHYLMEC